ncbi:MAG: lysine--tRNA ligase [Alphaproteobacteria bacterium]|nr:lysine--tRNA ligase [Alphaproteobacteria bacterium]
MAHWADNIADKVIQQAGDKPEYTVASGITPSGTIHFGKFREVITTELVARALMKRGKKVRFIYSWDDYDTFRKVPGDMPQQDVLKAHLYQPIVDIPDVYGTAENYARHNELTLENAAPLVGIDYIEFLYQNKKFRAGDYNDFIITTMDARDKIIEFMNEFKTEEIKEGWQPLNTYCSKCNRDRVDFGEYNKADKTIPYKCKLCRHEETLDLKTSKRLKLPWRFDWPMRWAYEKVDFEPGGRDHSSAGSSRDTGEIISREVYKYTPPVYAMYDQIRVKGQTKKMSSSAGNGFSLESVLEIYEPEIVRWFFASYKPDSMFDMAFDSDVIKRYEEFDQIERKAYEGDAYAREIYEFSQLNKECKIPETMPIQPGFRHVCTIVQLFDFDMKKVYDYFAPEIKNARDERRVKERSERAAKWLQLYAPEEFKFIVNKSRRTDVELNDAEQKTLTEIRALLDRDLATDGDLQTAIGEVVKANGLPAGFYKKIYQLLLSRDAGPKLGSLLRGIGKEKALNLL